MDKSEEKSEINIFEENCQLKQENVGLKNENAKLREENQALKEKIQKISVASIDKNLSAKMENPAQENIESPKMPCWLPDVLDWIKRAELAQSSLSTACWAFNQYCWPKLHGKVKARIVSKLTFLHEWDGEGNSRTKLEKENKVFIPIASTNPPEYINGFKEIKFYFLDGRALKFIRSILPLLNDVTIQFDGSEFYDNPKFGQTGHLISMLAPKTYEFDFDSKHYLSDFPRKFLNLLDEIQAISLHPRSGSEMNLLAEWLSTPRDDGKPKILYSYNFDQYYPEKLIDQVKKEFFDSMEPANFIVFIQCDKFYVPFFMKKNEKTDEILELYRKQESDNENMYFLVRHQKSDEAQRANWEEEFNRKSNTIIFVP